MKKAFIPIFLLGFFILSPDVLAYDSGTHAFLTESAVDLYSKTAAVQFPQELKDYLMDGSRREDDIPRSFNHFYDPVYRRGLTYNPVINAVNLPGKWETSKSWAENSASQNSIVYKIAPTIASILSAVERGKLSDVLSNSDFTWQRALDLYKSGKKEEAIFALGHVIHLIEDVSVPDHTRDDPHPGGSPYENWAAKFTPESPDLDLVRTLNGKQPVVFADLGSYFDGIANYSNNNFYSRNTIGLQSGYSLPVADMSDLDAKDGKYLVMGHDSEGNEYPLFKKNSVLSLLFDFKNITVTVDDGTILDSYWSLLSKKAVQYAAGVLDLFFKTVKATEIANQSKQVPAASSNGPSIAGAPPTVIPQPVAFTDRSVVKIGEKVIESGEHFTAHGQVALVFDLPNGKSTSVNIQADNIGAFQNIYQMPLDAVLGVYAYYAKDLTTGAVSGKVIYSVVSEIEEVLPANSTVITATSSGQGIATPPTTTVTAGTKRCSFEVGIASTRTPVTFNEIAWAGGSESYGLNASDEWFELRNITGSSIDLSGWQILSKKGSITISLPPGTSISPWGYFLLERTNDDSVPNITADFIYAGGLANSDDGLEIFDADCKPVDIVTADSEWPAGDSSLRRSMERKSDFSWFTSGNFNGKIFGTPRSPNGTAYIPSQNQAVYVGGGGQNKSSDNASPPDLAITEMMYDYPGSDAGHEWIEVKNVGMTTADLSEIKFYEGETAHNVNSTGGDYLLPAGGFAIFSNDSTTIFQDFPSFSGSLFYGSFSLNNISGSVALKYRDTVFGSVSYVSSTGAQGDGNSLQLIGDTWTWSRPTPGSENILDQSLIADETPTTMPTSTPPVVGSSTDCVVISEVQVGGIDAGDEFIELYNSGDHDVNLSGWSLQYLSGGAEAVSSSTTSKETFGVEDSIKSKGFFLIARGKSDGGDNGYVGTTTPDYLYRSFSLSGGSNGGAVLLVSTTTDVNSLNDGSIESSLFYGNGSVLADFHPAAVPESSGSLGRKAFRDGYCLSGLPGAEGEFLGKNCETGESVADFEVWPAAKPQNSQSLPEPRSSPTAPVPIPGEDAIAKYDFNGMTIGFAWSPSRDSTASPSGMVYELFEENNDNFSLFTATTAVSVAYPLSEVGKIYHFSMTALDRDGMPSATTNISVDAPLPVSSSSIIFSQNLLPSFSAGSHYSDNWYRLGRGFSGVLHALFLRGLVDRPEFSSSHVYLREFEDKDYTHEVALFTLSNNAPFTNAVHNVVLENLDVKFHPFSYYRLETYQDYQNRSVILAGTTATGTAMSNAFITDVGEIFNYYPFYPFMVMEGEPGPQVDISIPQKPTIPQIQSIDFNENDMALNISWSTSTDLDSLDSKITYEYNITNLSDFHESEWVQAGPNTSLSYPVSFPNEYKIGIRAVDDTGLMSGVASTTWEFPGGFSSSGIQLEISSAGFLPSTFIARSGSAMAVSLAGADDETHVFKFDDPSIQLSPSGVGPMMTRVITFSAPSSTGDYTFRCDVPGHAARGEVGTMTVHQ